MYYHRAIDPWGKEDHQCGADYLGIDVRAGLIVFAGAASGTIHEMAGPPGELVTLDLLSVLPGGTVGGLPNGNRIFTNTRDVVARFADQVFAINGSAHRYRTALPTSTARAPWGSKICSHCSRRGVDQLG